MTPTYTITITDAERQALAAALGTLVTKLTNAAPQIEAPAPQVAPPPTQSPAAAPPLSTGTGEPRDRWARDRKGNELANPAGATMHTAHLWKAQEMKTAEGKKYYKTTWQTPNGSGHVDANCFDEKLSLLLIANTGKRLSIWTVRKGNYLNVVGVRA